MAKYGRIKKKGLDNCQDPAIMDVKDWLFLQFATDAFVQFVADVSGVTCKKEATSFNVMCS